jgi:hypothetical protein
LHFLFFIFLKEKARSPHNGIMGSTCLTLGSIGPVKDGGQLGPGYVSTHMHAYTCWLTSAFWPDMEDDVEKRGVWFFSWAAGKGNHV